MRKWIQNGCKKRSKIDKITRTVFLVKRNKEFLVKLNKGFLVKPVIQALPRKFPVEAC